MPLIQLALSTALAAPVVWTAPPSAEQRAFVDAAGGDAEVSLAGLHLRSSAPEDPAARLGVLAKTLEEVRSYETRLDGERIIMDDLQAALDRIEVLRSDDDRSQVFVALAYQGFAVHRFFGDTLDGEEAAPWRASIQDTPVPTPWRDAVAIAPDREVTAYDIAEAPQRVAFGQTSSVVKGALPGGLRIEGAQGEVFVDGAKVDASGNLRVPPGLHYVHTVVDGQIAAHGKVLLKPGATVTVDLSGPAPPAVDLTGLTVGGDVPSALAPLIQAAGGELWVATPARKGAELVAVTASGIRQVTTSTPRPTRSETDGNGLYAVVSLGGGWLSSGDFYAQAPDVAPHARATVNTAALQGGVAAGLQLGVFRSELGLDALFTPGEHHVALSGDGGFRLRPTPYAAVGVTWLMATGGFLWPYHPVVGAKAALPLPAGLEVRADFRAGIPLSLTRADGTAYTTLPLYTLSGSIAYRFGPGAKTSTL